MAGLSNGVKLEMLKFLWYRKVYSRYHCENCIRLLPKAIFLLIGLSVIVTGCTPQKQQSPGQNPKAKEEISVAQEETEETSSEEMLSSFSVSGYAKGGKKQWDLEGKSADIGFEEIKLKDVTSKVYGEKMNMTIVADEGQLNRQNNNVHLEKNVRATSDDGAVMTTDYLDWDAQNQKLTSEAFVWIKRGMMEASGKGIIGQPALNLVELKEDVTVKISRQEEKQSPQKENSEKLTADEPLASSPTVITCTGPLEVEYENNLAIFYDDVQVKDSRGEIFADKMEVYFTTQSEGNKDIKGMEGMDIEKIMAFGSVEIHHGGNITYSQKAVYDTATGKLTLTGEPKLVIYSTEDFNQLMGGANKNEAQAAEENN